VAFVRAVAAEELWRGEMRGLLLEGRRLLLVSTEQGVCAYEDRCAHLGIPLSTGTFAGGRITCSAHHFQYDACTGLGINPENVRLVPFPLRIEAGWIFVDLSRGGKEGDV
jgi:toluene monooxygenase system ferredoxin subunit